MDFDPRIPLGSDFAPECGWQCNFHFGYGPDLIEADATNEKSVLQVLRTLIAKADTEIFDLEDHFTILQFQLKWAEDDKLREPYEILSANLKKKIDSLNSVIRTLREGSVLSENDLDTALGIDNEPAERICDMLNAFLGASQSSSEVSSETGSKCVTTEPGDLSNRKDQAVDPGLRNIDMEVKEQISASTDALSDSSMGPEGSMVVRKQQHEPANTGRDMGKFGVKMYGQDNFNLERKFSLQEEPEYLISLLHSRKSKTRVVKNVKASNYRENSRSDASQQAERTNCINTSKIIVKVEEADQNDNTQLASMDPLSELQDHETEDVKEEKVNANETPVMTSSRMEKSNQSITITTEAKEASRLSHLNMDNIRQSIPNLMLKLNGQRGKREPRSTSLRKDSSSAPKQSRKRKTGVSKGSSGTNLFVEEAMGRQVQGVGRDNAMVHSSKTKVFKDKAHANGVMVGNRDLAVKAIENPGSNSSHATDSAELLCNTNSAATKEDHQVIPLIYHDPQILGSLSSVKPGELGKLNLTALKKLAKQTNLKGLHKLNKQSLISELEKRLTGR